MITILIDGNNLIGKHKTLRSLQKSDKQASREKLAFMLDRYYQSNNNKVFLFFDGFAGTAIKTDRVRIEYSENLTADELIKVKVEQTENRRNLKIVTSDRNLSDFARACSCKLISSDDFIYEMEKKKPGNDEDEITNGMSAEEFKKLFDVK